MLKIEVQEMCHPSVFFFFVADMYGNKELFLLFDENRNLVVVSLRDELTYFMLKPSAIIISVVLFIFA